MLEHFMLETFHVYIMFAFMFIFRYNFAYEFCNNSGVYI